MSGAPMKRIPGELQIGEFASLAGVSAKALRIYADEGLLEPSRINPSNGYRYYQQHQLEVVHRIKSLQATGASLREIRLALQADAVLGEIEILLRRREEQIERQQRSLEAQKDEVHRQLAQLRTHRRDVRRDDESRLHASDRGNAGATGRRPL